MLLGNILQYTILCCIFKYNLALGLTYLNVIDFKVLKASQNNLRFINMSLSHPLFIWNLKHVVYGLYKQFPALLFYWIPFFISCTSETLSEGRLDKIEVKHLAFLQTSTVNGTSNVLTCMSPVKDNEHWEQARSRTFQDSSSEVRLGVHFIQNPRGVPRKEAAGNRASGWDTMNHSSKKEKFKLSKGMKVKTRGNGARLKRTGRLVGLLC